MNSIIGRSWAHRSFIFATANRNIKAQYTGSILGIAWAFIQPLMLVFIYTVVFSNVMGARIQGAESGYAYSIFLCAGLVPWLYFSDLISRLSNVFIQNAALIQKTPIPRLTFVFIEVITASFNFCILFGIFLLFAFAIGFTPHAPLTYFAVLCMQVLAAIGLGILLGALNVFIRDVGQLTGVCLQFGFWFTPIIYPVAIVPDWARTLLAYNPLTSAVQVYQGAWLPDAAVPIQTAWLLALCAMVFPVLGFAIYRRLRDDIPDSL